MMRFELLRSPRRQIAAVCGLYYGDRKSTAAIARMLDLHEADVWNTLAKHGPLWWRRYGTSRTGRATRQDSQTLRGIGVSHE